MTYKATIEWKPYLNYYHTDAPEKEPETEEVGMLSAMREQTALETTAEMFSIAQKKFNLYEVDTNFWITKKIEQIIEFTSGIEVLKIETPYKAMIGIGKLYNKDDVEKYVLNNVNLMLNGKKNKNSNDEFIFGGVYPAKEKEDVI